MPRPRSQYEQIGVPDGDDEDVGPQIEVVAPEGAEPQAEVEVEAERPAWLPDKFKTEEDFAKSYSSLENELRERGERERDLIARLDAMEEYAQQAQQPQQQPQTWDPMLAQYAAELEAARDVGDVQREAELQAWLNQYSLQRAFGQYEQQAQMQQQPQMQAQNELLAIQARQTLAQKYGEEWDARAERVGELLRNEPDLLTDSALDSFQGTVKALDRAYKLVEYEDLQQQMEQLREQGITAADLSRARKLSAQTLSGATGRAGEASEADKQLAEMQQALRGSSWEHGQASPTAR